MDGEVIYEDAAEPMVLGDSYSPDSGLAAVGAGCASCDGDGCSTCGVGGPFEFDLCNPYGFDGRQLCICLPSHGWASVEYLMWYASGMETPALVTTSPVPTAQASAGVLPGATTLYGGDNNILTDRLNGMRVRFGWWFVNNPNLGLEGEYVGTANESESFDRNSNGNPILARPFYNVLTGREDAELVAYPNVVSGEFEPRQNRNSPGPQSDSDDNCAAAAAAESRHLLVVLFLPKAVSMQPWDGDTLNWKKASGFAKTFLLSILQTQVASS